MKRLINSCGLAATLCLLSPTVSFAGDIPSTAYIGIAGGINQLSGSVSHLSNVNLVFNGTSQTNVVMSPNPTLYQRGEAGGLLAGYELLFPQRFLLGIEGRINAVNDNDTTHTSVHELNGNFNLVTSNKLKQGGDIDLLVKPGLLFNDSSRIYLLAGVASARFTTTNQAAFSNVIQFDQNSFSTLSATAGQTIKRRKTGSLFGIGAQHRIAGHFSLRLEYDYLNFGRVSAAAASTPITSSAAELSPFIVGSRTSVQANSRVRNNRVTLGVVYELG